MSNNVRLWIREWRAADFRADAAAYLRERELALESLPTVSPSGPDLDDIGYYDETPWPKAITVKEMLALMEAYRVPAPDIYRFTGPLLAKSSLPRFIGINVT